MSSLHDDMGVQVVKWREYFKSAQQKIELVMIYSMSYVVMCTQSASEDSCVCIHVYVYIYIYMYIYIYIHIHICALFFCCFPVFWDPTLGKYWKVLAHPFKHLSNIFVWATKPLAIILWRGFLLCGPGVCCNVMMLPVLVFCLYSCLFLLCNPCCLIFVVGPFLFMFFRVTYLLSMIICVSFVVRLCLLP